MWGMDLLGPFPKAPGGHTMLYVAIDYFTKWVEVKAVARPNSKAIEKFFYYDVVCRFSIPKVIVTDNGPQFASAEFCKFCDNLSIEHRFASVARPQANRQVEVTNRILLQSLKKQLGEAGEVLGGGAPQHPLGLLDNTAGRDRGISLQLNLWGRSGHPYRNCLSTFRIENYDEHENSEPLRNTLDLVLEKREQAGLQIASYQQKVAQYYNSRVKKGSVKPGDLVLRRAEVSNR
ncbi:uncharacterized protein LOC143853984 [Tasmannia lanceolata]|uniref:uncharacterized protein LOC143853984 n=1 Tax=Tasmannia lanceolata TaxID=3420 RepID=UPI0040627D30